MGKSPPYSKVQKHPDADPQATFRYDATSGAWDLKNLSLPDMRYQDSQHQWHALPINGSVALTKGTVLQFGFAPTFHRAKVDLVHLA